MGGKNYFGLNAGAIVNWKLNEKLLLQLELNIANIGHRSLLFDSGVAYSDWSVIKRYIGPTILAKYNIYKRLSIGVGFSFNYLSKITYKENLGNIPFEFYEMTFKRFDKSLNFEVSYQLNEHIEICLRYYGSLIPTNKIDEKEYWYVFDYKGSNGTYNEVFALRLNYFFNKNKKN